MKIVRGSRSLAAGILSGGRSTRMGTPKDLIVLKDGKTMISRVAEALLEITDRIIVAGPVIEKSLITTSSAVTVEFVSDIHPAMGPLSGVESVLSTKLADGYLIATCDQPLITPDLLEMLVNEAGKASFYTTDVIQPFPGYYPQSWLSRISESIARNELSPKRLIASSDATLISVPQKFRKLLGSCNSPVDLEGMQI
jgi:molybdopterin-guanine dinucleotide biosynthesis protein A